MAAQGRDRGRRVVLALIGLAVLLFAVAGSVATFYTDVLWFADLGHANVVWTRIVSALIVGISFAALAFALVYANMLIARRMAPRAFLTLAGSAPEQLQQVLVQFKTALEPVMRWVLIGVSLLVALGSGVSMASHWPQFQLALHAVPFGTADPQFGRDVSFFVFTLPVLRQVADWLTSTLILTLVLTALVHFFDGAIRPWERLRGFAPHVKAHLSVLAALIVLSQAFSYWISIFELDLSERGQVTGASYTDVHAQLPALQILIVIALVSAVILLLNIRSQGWRLPFIALGVWIGAAILVGSVFPALVQQFRVAPNEVAAESPYIARNIKGTREAFGLAGVLTRPFAANADLTPADVAADRLTLKNVRLWGPAVIKQTYKQLQEIRPYYDFNDVDIDRYVIDGARQEVLISGRELNQGQLPGQAQTWVNEHLSYTHGYGSVVSPVQDVTPAGAPQFVIRDIPPTSTTDLKIDVPGIYFGEETSDYVIAGSAFKELDFPSGGTNVTTRYAGKTGVRIGGLLNRLAFAMRFASTDVLFSGYITPESKVLFDRDIRTRIRALAPFLTLDNDPYIAIIDGRQVWIQDAYTKSTMYPYSQRAANGLNYIRNSVKVTVDAYDGTTTLYAFDPSDPVLKTWSKVFPGLFTDMSRMPATVRKHLRYPEDLFVLQAEMYENYHMLDPQVFYNKEDSWSIPGEGAGNPMAPFYVLMRLPEESTEDFLLMLPFTPRGKDNMIGWMAAKSDAGDYGRRLVYQFPKQKLILGPQQIQARVNQNPTFSAQLSLWNQRGSGVIFGNLLVIPIKDSIVYIQPLYLQAEQSPIPQFIRVVAAYGDELVMEPDLATALTKVFGFPPAGVEQAPSQVASAAVPTTGTALPGATVAGQLADARDLYQRAIAAQRAGDWATYGKLLGELGTVLNRLASQAPTTSAAPKR